MYESNWLNLSLNVRSDNKVTKSKEKKMSKNMMLFMAAIVALSWSVLSGCSRVNNNEGGDCTSRDLQYCFEGKLY
jgi:hypothetical protein